MATTFVDYTGDGNATKSFSFPSIKEADIKVDVDGVIKTTSTHYNITSYTTTGGGNVVFTSGNIPASPAAIRIFRDTDVDTAKATYTAGSSVKAGDLNNNQTQLLYAAQEEQNQTILTSDIKDGAITTAKIKADNITSALIADDQINSEHYVDGSIDTAHIADSQITSAKIADGTIVAGDLASNAITTVKITDSNITTAKIADSNITTAKIADSNVTTAKIAADAVNGTKIADDSINSEHYVDGSIDTVHIADNQITTAKIADANVTTSKIALDAITSALIPDDTINSEHYVADSIDSEHYAASSVDTTALGADAVTTAKIADANVTTAKIQDAAVTTSKIASQQVTGAKIANLQVGTPQLSDVGVTDAKLASNAVITSKITDANVTTVKIADSNVTLAKLASDLKQTSISNSDTQLPTSGAVVDYVAAQIAPLGGLEVVATEVAFPNTQPSAGVVISISDAGGVVFNGSGTSTTGRTVGGSTVTINNAPSSLNSETLVAGVGLMVSSTGSGQVYNYHKILGKEDDIKQLSDDINDFNARYRVGSSNPTSALDSGDLFFNTGSGKLLVYNGTQSAWEEAQSIGQYFINTISSYSGTGGNSASFNGSAYRFVLSNPGTVAEQHIVSVNGVVQKPNSGTSQPSEGFAIDGSSIIFSSAPPSSADFFIITIGSTVNIGTPSNGTVSTDKLASGAVTTVKIADDAVTAAKLASDAVVTASIVNANVTTAKIADDAVTAAKLASSAVVTASIVDDAVTQAKIADDAVGADQLASSAVVTASIVDDAVTADKIANSVNSAIAANTAKTSNATHTGEVTGGTALTIADNVVDEANLKVSNSPTNGYFLSAQSGNTGGLTWAEAQGTTINNNADNRIMTGSGTANTLNGEGNCTFDGTALVVVTSDSVTSHAGTAGLSVRGGDAVNDYVNFTFRGNGYAIGGVHGKTEGISGSNGSGSLTFSTANSGTITERVQINQNGHMYPVANNTYDLGLSSNRWRNIYTNDLNLSNEGSSNDVDGTWGNWTIQEGESDLFLKNNRSGKKYKFNLTEVS